MGSPTGAPKRKRLNADQKRALAAAQVRTLMDGIGRKAHKGHDPNDRGYDRELEQRVRHMNPVELDRLMRDDE